MVVTGKLKAPQHLELRLAVARGRHLVGSLGRRRRGQPLRIEGLELHRVRAGGGGGLHEAAGAFGVAVMIDAGLRDHEAGRPAPDDTFGDPEAHHAVQPPSTTMACPVT